MSASITNAFSSTAYIVPLIQASEQAQEVGAKAARLSALLRQGERVPDGFCIVGTGDTALAMGVEAYRHLGTEVPVAVRSSAGAEDGSESSFAGQFDTILNVKGEQAFADAVKRCWASASGQRAEAYRGRSNGADSVPVRMAVLVQCMIPARAAGVAFSANPLTGAREEVVIEATIGLGDALVSGEIVPDEFVVSSRGEVRVQSNHKTEPTLTETEVQAIASLARRIEAYAGTPQDIEWAVDATGLWLLQARPITALPNAVRWDSPVPAAKWIKDLMAAEWVTEPLSPLGVTTTLETMAVAREQWNRWPPVPKTYLPGHTSINGWLYMRADMRPSTLMANLLAGVFSILTGIGMNGHRHMRRFWPQHLAALETLEAVNLKTLSNQTLAEHINRLLTELGVWWMEVALFRSATRVSEQFIGQLQLPGIAEPSVLFRGNDSLLLEAERALRKVANGLASKDDYLKKFGHFVESADPIHATLRESPEHLAWQLAAAQHTEKDPDERLASFRSERMYAEAVVRTMRGLQGWLARRILALGQSYAAHTDDAVFHFQRVLSGLRAAFLEVGARLVRAGKLQQAEDVFYLEHSELSTGIPTDDLKTRVTERRALREQQKRLAPPPFIPPVSDFVWANDPNFKRMPAAMRASMLERGLQIRDGHRVLVGTPGSPGRTRGIARVVTTQADFARFQAGDVLVAHATSPIWTPLFGIAAAAITEVGGPFAHAAIVAREFGIPLVDGALDATRLIPDGTPVVVDGSTGIVEF